MSTNKPRQLIEHISDQYVLSAANPEQAFAREAEKRKKNHTKILAIACATAAVYVLIIVSIILGTRPSTPPEPPTPGISDNLTEENGYQQLRGYWIAVRNADAVDTETIPNIQMLNFQPDGRVYLLDTVTQTGHLWKYTLSEDTVTFWMPAENDQWEESDITMKLISLEADVTEAVITVGEQNLIYRRPYSNDIQMSIAATSGNSPSEATKYLNHYIEKVVLPYDESSNENMIEDGMIKEAPAIRYELPDIEFMQQLEVVPFSTIPSISITSDSEQALQVIRYKLYDKDLKLLTNEVYSPTVEGDSHIEIPFIFERGKYYLDIAVSVCEKSETSTYDYFVTHFYAAIQVGESENPPISDSLYMPTQSALEEGLRAVWIYNSNELPKYRPTYFIFTPISKFYQSNFYMFNAETGDVCQGTCEIASSYTNGYIIYSLETQGPVPEGMQVPEIVRLNLANDINNYTLTAFYSGEAATYLRRPMGTAHITAWSGASGKTHQVSSSYIEKFEVSDSQGYEHNEFSFDPPEEMLTNTFYLEGNRYYRIEPSVYFNGSSVSYTIYREDGSVYLEGDLPYRNGTTEYFIPTIPDGNTYYYDIRYTCDKYSDRFSLVYHACFAIHQWKPISSPALPEDTEFAAPDPSYFSSRLSGTWYPNNTQTYIPYWFFPQPDGRIYIVNINTGESDVGRYLLTDTGIEIYTHEDGVGWVKQNFVMELDPEKDKMTVSLGESSVVFERSEGYSYSVNLWMGDQTKRSNDFYIEEIDIPYRGVSFQFDLPDFEIFKQLTPFDFTYIPRFYLSRGGATASYKVYDQNGNLIRDVSVDPDDRAHTLEIPDEYGIYYLDVRHTYRFSFSQVAHTYIAIHYHEEERPGADYTPPVLSDDRVIIPLLDCDTPLEHMTLDTENAVQGTGCASVTFTNNTSVITPNKLDIPIDGTGMEFLEFDLYISDPTLFEDGLFIGAEAALEITSAGTCDYEELTFTWETIIRYGLAGQELKEGWNHVVLPLSLGQETGYNSTFDLSQIDFMRFYIIPTYKLPAGEYTVKIDNICLSANPK